MPQRSHSRLCPECGQVMETTEKQLQDMAGKSHLDSFCRNAKCARHNVAVREEFASGCPGRGPCGIHDVGADEECPSPYEPCGSASH
jgi:hypothetical protein